MRVIQRVMEDGPTRPRLVGTILTENEFKRLKEICAPHGVSDMIEAMVKSLLSGDLTLRKDADK